MMPSANIEHQLEAILGPISIAHPCGEDLSFSPDFDRIHEARREDDPTVDYGEWTINLKQADWHAVIDICTKLLIERSKDLRVAAWLCEGLVKVGGLTGLATGLNVVSGLICRFGQDLYPQVEDGDDEQRIGILSWFILRSTQLVRQVPLTNASAGQYSLLDYETARALQSQVHKTSDRPAEATDKPTLEKIAAAVAATSEDCYKTWIVDADRARQLTDELSDLAVTAFGDSCPSFTQLADCINAVCAHLKKIANERGMGREVGTMEERTGSETAVEQKLVGKLLSVSAAGLTRVQALAQLREVAIFFRESEPHSPVAYLVDKAARWADMPLHAWLHEVVKDSGTLSHLDEMLGLKVKIDEA
ncbi:type VI secretion system protein TssA [Herbaspirillum sp. GCM10030257]|uniref:type VI secretion system protein TssA n=1 Tax=Herbaspirillum sp. GCM10030257 TaxID=3273393 RepID=UPI00361E2D8E